MDRTDEYFGRAEDNSMSDEQLGSATLTLAEIEKRTGISYVTLIRYAQQYRDRLRPHCEGEGTQRRYYHTAVGEFQAIKEEKTSSSVARGSRKKTRTKAAKKPAVATSSSKPTPPKLPDKPLGSKIPTGAVTVPTPDLDRMAKLYQLQIQHKALDGVLKFVTEWWTQIDAEIKELER